MNQTLQLIAKRHSCRAFLDKEISSASLQAIASAGNQAPTGVNRQHYQIIVVKNKALIGELEQEGIKKLKEHSNQSMYQRIMSRGGKLFYNAPCLIFIAIKEAVPKGAELIDLGIVAQNMVIAAASLGIDSCHCGLLAFAFAGDKANDFKRKLKVPAGYECGLGILLGYGVSGGNPHTPDSSKISYIE